MLKPTLILATIIYLLVLVPALMFAPFAIFLFDSGDADIFVYAFAFCWFSFPASLIIALLGGWFARIRNMMRAMTILFLLPIAHAVCIVLTGLLLFAR